MLEWQRDTVGEGVALLEETREAVLEEHALRDRDSVTEVDVDGVFVNDKRGERDADWEGVCEVEEQPLADALGLGEAEVTVEALTKLFNDSAGEEEGEGVDESEGVAVELAGVEDTDAVPSRTLRLCVADTDGEADTLRVPVPQGEAEPLKAVETDAAMEAVTLGEPELLPLALLQSEPLPLALSDRVETNEAERCGEGEGEGDPVVDTVPDLH